MEKGGCEHILKTYPFLASADLFRAVIQFWVGTRGQPICQYDSAAAARQPCDGVKSQRDGACVPPPFHGGFKDSSEENDAARSKWIKSYAWEVPPL